MTISRDSPLWEEGNWAIKPLGRVKSNASTLMIEHPEELKTF